MRRSRVLVGIASAAAIGLGCNALLGIETAEVDPPVALDLDGAPPDATLTDRDVVGDGADVLVDPCTDIDTNPRHCGACGHDCLGGACVAGQCQPVVVSLEPAPPSAIATDEAFVYWTTPALGDVRRAKKDGGPVEVVYDGPPNTPFGRVLARYGASVYFSVDEAADGGVYACAASGCGSVATPVLTGLSNPASFDIADGGALVVAENVFSGRIRRCSLPCGGVVEDVATDERFPTFVTTAPNAVLWDTLIPIQGNVRVANGGSPPVSIQTNLPARELRVAGSVVYIADLSRGVLSSGLDGGPLTKLYAPTTATENLTIDGTSVYFTDKSPTRGRVIRCALGGCGDAGVVLAKDQVNPDDLAGDEKQIFWVNQGESDAGAAVVRVAK